MAKLDWFMWKVRQFRSKGMSLVTSL